MMVQYGLVEGEGDSQNTPYGGGAELIGTESSAPGEPAPAQAATPPPDSDRKRKAE